MDNKKNFINNSIYELHNNTRIQSLKYGIQNEILIGAQVCRSPLVSLHPPRGGGGRRGATASDAHGSRGATTVPARHASHLGRGQVGDRRHVDLDRGHGHGHLDHEDDQQHQQDVDHRHDIRLRRQRRRASRCPVNLLQDLPAANIMTR